MPLIRYTQADMIISPARFIGSLVGLAMIAQALPAFAQTLDTRYTSVFTSRASVKADGIDNAIVTVTLKNANLLALRGLTVTLTSSRGSADEIIAEQAASDSSGRARFLVRSLKNGTATFSASAQNTALPQTVQITFVAGLNIGLIPGDLVKIPDDGDTKTLNDTAVYYYANNGKRYVFPNEKTYFTWYPDFSPVKIIATESMSLIPIGGNVTYRPGTRMVKFQTDPKTYIVTRGGILRWIKSEETARAWFGAEWNRFVDDISESFYVNYTFGQPITTSVDLALDQVKLATQTIDQDKGLPKNP